MWMLLIRSCFLDSYCFYILFYFQTLFYCSGHWFNAIIWFVRLKTKKKYSWIFRFVQFLFLRKSIFCKQMRNIIIYFKYEHLTTTTITTGSNRSNSVVKWTRWGLRQMNQRTRKLITMHKALYPRYDIDRFYMSRKEEGREIASIDNYLNATIELQCWCIWLYLIPKNVHFNLIRFSLFLSV